MPGNGTRGGYTTRYAPIIPYSESVYVDGKRLQRELDYWIDYASGSIAFAQPVRRISTVQVYYRYDPQGKREGVVGALPILTLSLGQGGSLNALYMPGVTETTRDGAAYHLSAYGMQNALRFGGGGTLQGYFFVGSREAISAYAAPNTRDPQKPNIAPSETAQFVVQQLQLDTGALQIRANYQDIGKGFSAQKMLGDAKRAGREPTCGVGARAGHQALRLRRRAETGRRVAATDPTAHPRRQGRD
jgi:hypothetical protein